MTSNLNELKDRLYEAFDAAIARGKSEWAMDGLRNTSVTAAAELAKAIVVVETRLDERESAQKSAKLHTPGT